MPSPDRVPHLPGLFGKQVNYILSLIDRAHIVKALGGHNRIPANLIHPHNILSTSHGDSHADDVPADGDVLTWNDTNGEWEASPPTGLDHNLLSTTHPDTDAVTSPSEGDGVVRRSGAWAPEAGVDIGSDSADITAVNFTDQGSDVAAPGAGHTILYLLASGVARLRTATTIYNLLVGVMTTLGDTMYGGASGALTRLSGNTTTTRMFLRQVGNGAVSAAPAWDTLVAGDYPEMVGSGASHARGAVPDPGADAGTTKYLREDGTWQEPPGTGSVVGEILVDDDFNILMDDDGNVLWDG